MNEIKELFEIVESVAATRPAPSLPYFLPRQVLELGVLNLLDKGPQSGPALIRELSPLSRRASGYGVSYPLLHDMEAEGNIQAYQIEGSVRRVYALTEAGHARLQQLSGEYDRATIEQYQAGINVIYGTSYHIAPDVTSYAC